MGEVREAPRAESTRTVRRVGQPHFSAAAMPTSAAGAAALATGLYAAPVCLGACFTLLAAAVVICECVCPHARCGAVCVCGQRAHARVAAAPPATAAAAAAAVAAGQHRGSRLQRAAVRHRRARDSVAPAPTPPLPHRRARPPPNPTPTPTRRVVPLVRGAAAAPQRHRDPARVAGRRLRAVRDCRVRHAHRRHGRPRRLPRLLVRDAADHPGLRDVPLCAVAGPVHGAAQPVRGLQVLHPQAPRAHLPGGRRHRGGTRGQRPPRVRHDRLWHLLGGAADARRGQRLHVGLFLRLPHRHLHLGLHGDRVRAAAAVARAARHVRGAHDHLQGGAQLRAGLHALLARRGHRVLGGAGRRHGAGAAQAGGVALQLPLLLPRRHDGRRVAAQPLAAGRGALRVAAQRARRPQGGQGQPAAAAAPQPGAAQGGAALHDAGAAHEPGGGRGRGPRAIGDAGAQGAAVGGGWRRGGSRQWRRGARAAAAAAAAAAHEHRFGHRAQQQRGRGGTAARAAPGWRQWRRVRGVGGCRRRPRGSAAEPAGARAP